MPDDCSRGRPQQDPDQDSLEARQRAHAQGSRPLSPDAPAAALGRPVVSHPFGRRPRTDLLKAEPR